MQRLDVFLSKCFKDYSRAFLQKFIKKVGVIVGGRPIYKPHYIVRDDEKIVFAEAPLERYLNKQNAQIHKEGNKNELPLIFEDSHIYVVDKPAGIVSHFLPRILENGYFLVHRLDKDTSGVLVFAKDEEALRSLQNQWKARTVRKTYCALVKGKLEPRTGAIDAPLLRSKKDRRRIAVSTQSGARSSYTEYKVLKYFHDATLVEFYPKTGRTHQIRVHCAAIGHPIVGDRVYGDIKLNKKFEQEYGLSRQFLHAEKLTLKNPATQKNQTFTARMPLDLQHCLDVFALL